MMQVIRPGCVRTARAGLLLAMVLLGVPDARAQSDAPTGPAKPTLPADDAAHLEAALITLEEAGKDLRSLRAEFTYRFEERIKEDEDDEEIRTHYGLVVLQKAAEGGRARIEFTRWTDGVVLHTDDRRWFVFDGEWLEEAREKDERRIRYQVVPEGQRVDPFRLGEGPFPLPFGQTRADMHREFDIRLVEPDAQGRVHLVGKPRPESQLVRRYDRVDLFLARGGALKGLAEKIVLYDRKERQIKTVEFKEARLNSVLSTQDFELPPKSAGWSVTERPYEKLE